ncbi:MAG: hypothetical protein IT168_13270 [Bryobacterales bacterium]|nr:hypothetical protein [Bryobacterales bacterium]
MTPPDIRKLIAGYASGTLSEAERKVLFEAALHDQALFDALADEEALRELLADAEFRGELLEALNEVENAEGENAERENAEAEHAPRQASTAPPSPPRLSRWWRLPVYGSLAAALAVAVGLFLTSRTERHYNVALTRPAATEVPPPPSYSPQFSTQSADRDQRTQPPPRSIKPLTAPVAPRDPLAAAVELARKSRSAQLPEAATSSVPAPLPAESNQSFRVAEAEPAQRPQPMIAAAPPPPAPAKSSSSMTPVASPAPAGAAPAPAAAKTAGAATPPFSTAGHFRYRVEQLGPDDRWAPAPAQLHAGAQLRLFITPSETGTVIASLPENRTEILHALAGESVTLPIPSSPGILRIGLSLQTLQADTALRPKRLSRAPAAPTSSAPSSDVEIRLEILP